MSDKTLPKLTGSKKQIEWAEDIRPLMIQMVEEDLDEERFDIHGPHCDIRFKDIEDAMGWLVNHTAASWWIRKRNDTTAGVLSYVRPHLAPPYRVRG